MNLNRIYQTKIKRLVSEFLVLEPEKIILFGSVSRGKITGDPDIDLCVIKDTSNILELKHKLRDIIWEKKIGFTPEIDIHVYTPAVYNDWLVRHDPFIEEIENGEVLYEGSNS